MSSTDLPVSLRPASHTTARRADAQRTIRSPGALGTTNAAERIAAKLREADVLYQQIEDLGGHEELLRHVGDKAAEMRVEGESRKARAGRLNAFAALPIVRETDQMLARDKGLSVAACD